MSMYRDDKHRRRLITGVLGATLAVSLTASPCVAYAGLIYGGGSLTGITNYGQSQQSTKGDVHKHDSMPQKGDITGPKVPVTDDPVVNPPAEGEGDKPTTPSEGGETPTPSDGGDTPTTPVDDETGTGETGEGTGSETGDGTGELDPTVVDVPDESTTPTTPTEPVEGDDEKSETQPVVEASDKWSVTKDSNGKLQRYRVHADGSYVTGHFVVDGIHYYGRPDTGYVVRGRWSDGHQVWYADNDGKLLTQKRGMVVTHDLNVETTKVLSAKRNAAPLRRYYVTSDYGCRVGAFQVSSQWYYGLPTYGNVLTSRLDTGSGHVYVADKDGKLVMGTKSDGTGWVVTSAYDGHKERYYIDKNHAAKSGFFKIGNSCYYGVSKQGYVLRGIGMTPAGLCAADHNGVLVDGNGWYNMDSGVPKRGRGASGTKDIYIKSTGKGYATLVTGTQTIDGKQYTFNSDGYLGAFPQWVEDLHYVQGGHDYDEATFGAREACGVISMTTAIQILKNDLNATDTWTVAGLIKGVEDTPGIWFFSVPRHYGLQARFLIHGDASKVDGEPWGADLIRKELESGHMVIVNSQDSYFMNLDGSQKWRPNHTIMFYKYENGIFYAKDSGIGAASVPYTADQLIGSGNCLIKKGTGNYVVSVFK